MGTVTVVECDAMPQHMPEGTSRKKDTNKNARKVGLWAETAWTLI
jgi:hypothetical protein